MKTIKGLLINIQFFTSIPVPMQIPMDKAHLKRAVVTFPILGLLQGLFYSLVLYGFLEWTPFSPLASAFALWLAMIILTGGIHLDGWMDASDAFFSYQDREKRLEIMKDPRTGAFGVLSAIVLLAARFLFIYEIVLQQQPETYWLIALIPFLGKQIMGVLLMQVRPAKPEGLGALFQKAASARDLAFYPAAVLLVFVLYAMADISLAVHAAILLLAAAGFLMFAAVKSVKWFGGITGDVLGASAEGAECFLWMVLWLLHYFAMS